METFFDTSHQGIAQFNNVSEQDHATVFSIWAFAIHLGQLSKVHHTLTPKDAEIIHLPLLHASANTTNAWENLQVFKHLSKGLKQLGKVAEQSNTLKQEEITLKEKEEEKKKDRIKDMHPSISNMFWMASAMEPDHIGEFRDSFKSFYNSKNQGYTDLELHNQFDNKAFHNVGFQ